MRTGKDGQDSEPAPPIWMLRNKTVILPVMVLQHVSQLAKG